ncbi:isochorismate synthase [Roseomonas mucosa]|uniref:isochorismate synthase n=1 Tax=Roseomonas mucosa TaxID=207340 RepID=UPI0028CD4381|nr:isochorismate synthase [Roseomonas mucosa]MDT8275278.1 isochorismate synthase [Roseomonas mucosa]
MGDGSIPAEGGASPSAASAGRATGFAFLSGRRRLRGDGMAGLLPRGPAATLGERVRGFFRAQPEAPLLAGALPFDRAAPDYLTAPRRVAEPAGAAAPPDAAAPRWSLRPEPSAAVYAASVSRALEAMAAEPALAKLVLSRRLLATADRDIDPEALLRRLDTDPAVTAFLVPLPPAGGGTPRLLAGATPELLVARRGRAVLSHPLAGSARREADPAADRAAAEALGRSGKDRREHALVAEFILDMLGPHCRNLAAPEGTTVTATRSMWHLGTRIEGELKDPDTSAADLAALLHPTPAVCGVPRDRAAERIQALEGHDRDFYAGAVGWCDRDGDGAWHVSIRCAEIAGNRARLYAGAGIVPGSDPEAEARETAAKFRAMLNALGVPPGQEFDA